MPVGFRFSGGLGDQLVRLRSGKADGSGEFRSRSVVRSGIHSFGLVEVIDNVVILRSVAFIPEGVVEGDRPSFLRAEHHAVHGSASVGSKHQGVQNRVGPAAFFRVAFHDDVPLVSGKDGILVIEEHGSRNTVNGVVLNKHTAAVVDELQAVGPLKCSNVPFGRVAGDGDLPRIDEGCFPIHQEGAITVVRGFVAGNGDVSRVGKGQVPVELPHAVVPARRIIVHGDVSGPGERGITGHLNGAVVLVRAVSGKGNVPCIRHAERSVKAQGSVGTLGGVSFHSDVPIVAERGIAEDGYTSHLIVRAVS